MSVCAVVGAQFGSEGKGAIVGHVAKEYDHHVRVGAANAGHTVYEEGGAGWTKHVMQQVPCAAYANPDADLYVGPGALISPEIFNAELELLHAWREEHGLPKKQVRVDRHAHVIQDRHIHQEAQSNLAARIGSTSTIAREGIGVAQAARVMRDESCDLAQDHYQGKHRDLVLSNVPLALTEAPSSEPKRVLLEGTQGYGLSLTNGDFPYVTSRNTTAAGLCADAGVAPTKLSRVILVCRSYPIRVAGNSGPFHYASDEISWDVIGVDPENERTTVTKKVRRVATFSAEQVIEAATVNGATEIALTFADYLDRRIAGHTETLTDGKLQNYPKVYNMVHGLEQVTGLPVVFVGTGPHSAMQR